MFIRISWNINSHKTEVITNFFYEVILILLWNVKNNLNINSMIFIEYLFINRILFFIFLLESYIFFRITTKATIKLIRNKKTKNINYKF